MELTCSVQIWVAIHKILKAQAVSERKKTARSFLQ